MISGALPLPKVRSHGIVNRMKKVAIVIAIAAVVYSLVKHIKASQYWDEVLAEVPAPVE